MVTTDKDALGAAGRITGIPSPLRADQYVTQTHSAAGNPTEGLQFYHGRAVLVWSTRYQ